MKKRLNIKAVAEKKWKIEKGYIIFKHKKLSIYWIIFIIVLIHFLYVSIGKTIENNNLTKCGSEAFGVINDVRKVGSKGIIRCTYEFSANNNFYSGFIDDDYLSVGDTITVIYLDENPEINRAKKFLDHINN